MRNLTAEGQAIIEDIARRHGMGTDAVIALLQAVEQGGGSQAQFSHPDLGGMGQWSRGGMIMIGDMFNNGLKSTVDMLCNELSDILRTRTLFVPEQPYDSAGGNFGSTWWPSSFGRPSSTGSQNDMSYACFPEARRLAIRRGGHVTLYDTADHRISGVSQQQSDTQNLTFTSQYGTVRLYDLGLIRDQTQTPPALANNFHQASAFEPDTFQRNSNSFNDISQTASRPYETGPAQSETREDDIFAKIERLHELHGKGILSETEFLAKKKDLLDRL